MIVFKSLTHHPRGGNVASLQIFLIVSTCFLYLVAAGLFSKGVWALEINAWNKILGGDAADVGSGAGSYDVRKSVWHVNVSQPSSVPI
jgi:high-affinity iron transporter